MAGLGLGPRLFALHLSVARELEQLQGASWAWRGAAEGGWSLERGAGRHPCGQSPPRGGGGATSEREGGRGERRGNSESGFQELKMREPALGGRGQGGLL